MQVVFHPPATEPVLTFPGIGTRPAGFRTLISVAPIEYRKQYIFAGFPTYVLPAAPKGGYAMVRVYDHQIWQLNRNTVTDTDPGKMDLLPMDANAVATDFFNYCILGNLGATEGRRPGVILCAGKEPTEAEISEAFRTHTEYARWVVNDGTALYNKDQHQNITDEHRRQADWLGVDVPWRDRPDRVETKKCVACGGKIFAEALRCNHCQVNLVEFCESMDIVPEGDPVVARVIAARAAKKSAAIVNAEATAAPAIKPPLQPVNNLKRQ